MDLNKSTTRRQSRPATGSQKALLCYLARTEYGLVPDDMDAMEWLSDEYEVNMDELTVAEFVRIKSLLEGE